MRRAAAAAIVTLVCTLSSCASDAAPSDPVSELRSALRATLAADSFAVSSTVRHGGEVLRGDVEYVAPDRYTITGSGESDPTTIGVGRDTYFSDPEDPGRYHRMESDCDVPIEEVISFLEVVDQARDVVVVDGLYHFRVPNLALSDADGDIRGEARTDGGRLVSVRLRYALPDLDTTVDEQHTIHGFGRGFTIEPPSPGQIVDETDEGVGVIVVETPTPVACPA
jgi:hypothetical protein